MSCTKEGGDFAKQQSEQSRRASEETSFKSKHNVSDEDYNDLMNYTKSHKLTLEDVYYLKNRDNRDNESLITLEMIIQQMKMLDKCLQV